MRARFVNEKFTEKSDPVVDMGIGTIQHLNAIKNALEDEDSMPITWESVEEDKEELTLRFDAIDYYDVENFNSKKFNSKKVKSYDWNSVGVFDPFQWDYYIDVILNKNQVVRNSHFSNPLNIESLDYWDQKILCNNALDIDPEEIADIVYDDYNNYDISDAASEAWEIAKAEDEKDQKE